MRPALSVIIPSYNRRELLARCLRTLEQQTLAAGQFEVIVVLDGSTDGSREALTAQPLTFRPRVLSLSHAGAAAARNAGVEAAVGNICVFVDDDVLLEATGLAAHLAAHLQRPEQVVVVGRLSTRSAHRGFPRYGDKYWEAIAERQVRRSQTGKAGLHGGNMSMPRELARRFPFDTSIARLDDIELTARLEAAGISRIYSSKAAGVHLSPKTTTECLRDIFEEGSVSARLWKSGSGNSQSASASIQSRLKAGSAFLISRVHLPGAVARAAGAVPEWLPAAGVLFRALRANAYLRGAASELRGFREWEEFLQRDAAVPVHTNAGTT